MSKQSNKVEKRKRRNSYLKRRKAAAKVKTKAAPKPGSAPDAKDDSKTLPMAEVEKKLGSSPDGLTQAERRNG